MRGPGNKGHFIPCFAMLPSHISPSSAFMGQRYLDKVHTDLEDTDTIVLKIKNISLV